MKPATLEPGLLQMIKILLVFQLIGVLIIRPWVAIRMELEMPIGRSVLLALVVPLFLIVFTWHPWWREPLGQLFLPFTLVIASLNFILDKYLTIAWFTPPVHQEMQILLLVINFWLNMLLLVLVVAWQYSLRSVLFTALVLSLADVLLSLPFMQPGSELYSITLILFFARTVTILFVAVVVQWLAHRQREQRVALWEANQKLAHYAVTTEQLAVSQERNRLARELHDTLAHSISGAAVQLEAVQALWDVQPREARQMLDQALEVTQNGLTEARRALQSLRASPLDDLGLTLAIRDMAKSTSARANLRLDLDLQNHIENLAPEVEQCVYRVAQEALVNAARHADAKTLHVALQHDASSLTLTVADDGRGFDPAQVNNARYGLKGLRERAEVIGGTLEVDSQPLKGTTVQLVIPLLK